MNLNWGSLKQKNTCILEYPLSFPLVVIKEPKKNIERVSAKIEEFSRECGVEDLNVRVDCTPTIKPVGINLEDIIKWLRGDRIYDTEDNRVKPLGEISKTYFQTLLRYSVFLRIFVDRKKFKKYPHITEKIKKEAREKLKNFELEWSTLFLP